MRNISEMMEALDNLKEIQSQLNTKKGFWLSSKVVLSFKGNIFPREYTFNFDRLSLPIYFDDFRKEIANSMNEKFKAHLPSLIERLEKHIGQEVEKQLKS